MLKCPRKFLYRVLFGTSRGCLWVVTGRLQQFHRGRWVSGSSSLERPPLAAWLGQPSGSWPGHSHLALHLAPGTWHWHGTARQFHLALALAPGAGTGTGQPSGSWPARPLWASFTCSPQWPNMPWKSCSVQIWSKDPGNKPTFVSSIAFLFNLPTFQVFPVKSFQISFTEQTLKSLKKFLRLFAIFLQSCFCNISEILHLCTQ